jgi:hypothetical protein
MQMIMSIITGTPWYVYLIILYLIFVGFKAVKGGSVPIAKLFILPILFVWMSVSEITSSITITSPHVLVAAIGAILGAYILGWLPYSKLNITADPSKRLLHIPGSWFSLALIIITFAVKYTIGVTLAIDSNITGVLLYSLLFASSLFTGAFVGRLAFGLYKINKGPYTTAPQTAN